MPLDEVSLERALVEIEYIKKDLDEKDKKIEGLEKELENYREPLAWTGRTRKMINTIITALILQFILFLSASGYAVYKVAFSRVVQTQQAGQK